MRTKTDKLKLRPAHRNKVYHAKHLKKNRGGWWQYLYSLFF